MNVSIITFKGLKDVLVYMETSLVPRASVFHCVCAREGNCSVNADSTCHCHEWCDVLIVAGFVLYTTLFTLLVKDETTKIHFRAYIDNNP